MAHRSRERPAERPAGSPAAPDPAAAPSGRPPGVPESLRRGLHVLVALASLLGTAAGLRGVLPRTWDSDLSVKLARLAELPEVDTIFLGSSVVHRQVDPRAFDARTAELGRPTRSFNAGARWMSSLEASHALDELLRARPAGLRRVVLDARQLGLWVPWELRDTARFQAWHDRRTTLSALRLLLASDRPAEVKRFLAADHLRAGLRRAVNAGDLVHALGAPGGEELAARRADVLGPAGDGFAPLDEASTSRSRRRTSERERWRTRLRRIVASHARAFAIGGQARGGGPRRVAGAHRPRGADVRG